MQQYYFMLQFFLSCTCTFGGTEQSACTHCNTPLRQFDSWKKRGWNIKSKLNAWRECANVKWGRVYGASGQREGGCGLFLLVADSTHVWITAPCLLICCMLEVRFIVAVLCAGFTFPLVARGVSSCGLFPSCSGAYSFMSLSFSFLLF